MESSPDIQIAAPTGVPALRAETRPRVLAIDDELLFGRSLERILARTSEVTVLASAVEALRRIDAGERWDFILCDVHMPELDGIGFYEALRARHPALLERVAFMSGGVFGVQAQFFADRSLTLLQKPLSLASLAAAMHELGVD
jgi:CheY-like chemotaxis protein